MCLVPNQVKMAISSVCGFSYSQIPYYQDLVLCCHHSKIVVVKIGVPDHQ